MTVLGAHVPVSWWSLLVLVAGIVVAVLASPRLAVRAGWRPLPTFAALGALAATLAVTVTPSSGTIGVSGSIGVDGCLPDYASQLLLDPFYNSGGVAGGLLNLSLFLPLGLAAALATCRWSVPTVLVVLVPLAVEVAQSWIPGRYCNSSDISTNIVGGLLGVLIGMAYARLWAPRREEAGEPDSCFDRRAG